MSDRRSYSTSTWIEAAVFEERFGPGLKNLGRSPERSAEGPERNA